jgi:hypothetical protein
VVVLRRAEVPSWCILAGLLSPAAMWNLYLGQLGLFCGALLIFGLSRMGTARGGATLGLLALKPQYAIIVPFAALAARGWRTLAAGALVLAALLALAWVLAGSATFAAYLTTGRAATSTLLNQSFTVGTYQDMGTSVFWTLRSLHLGTTAAYAGQGLVALLAAAGTMWLWRRPDYPNRLFITLLLTLLASPYGYTDDLAASSILLPTLARRDTPWRNAALAWLWLAPAFIRKATLHTDVLLTPLLLLAALALCLVQIPRPSVESTR